MVLWTIIPPNQAVYNSDGFTAQHRADLIRCASDVAWVLFLNAHRMPRRLRRVLCGAGPPNALHGRLRRAMAAALQHWSTMGGLAAGGLARRVR